MATYVLLLTLTPEGRARVLEEPESLLRAAESVAEDAVDVLGVYGVLGAYDFVAIVDAPGNEEIGRFSLTLGVRGGAHVQTLPAIPYARLKQELEQREAARELKLSSVSATSPEQDHELPAGAE